MVRTGYGLAWSPFMEGHLLSGSDDAQICLWDINSVTKTGRKIEARSIFREHLGVVEVRRQADVHSLQPILAAPGCLPCSA